jgi:hypothetical protein
MKKRYALGCIVFLFFISFHTNAQIISTIAGNGTAGFSGDGASAILAKLDHPHAVAVDAAGNVYIADKNNNRIRKVSTAGDITTIAGLTAAGYSGDGLAATLAQLNNPNGVAVDATGNIYICDGDNSCIRKINTLGIISTVAGNGTAGYGGDGGPATAAVLNLPSGIALDAAGNLYIDDNNNYRIRKITSGTITTVAGTGTLGYTGDGTPATAADIPFSYGVAVDGSGNLFISFYDYSRIRKVNTLGYISTFAGDGTPGFVGDGGPATAAEFDGPWGIAADATGNVFISDQNNNRVRKINTSGNIATVAGSGSSIFSGDGGPATAAGINSPIGVAVDGSGNIFIVDYLNERIRRVGATIVDHAPFFTGGHFQSLTLCENSTASIDTLLSVSDPDVGQTETWSVILAPAHGSVVAAYVTTSTGGTLIPSGLSYTPTVGYTGTDSFKIRVSDGTDADTTTIHITVNPLPNAGTITGADSLCPGTTTTLTDLTAGGTWASSNMTITTVSSTGMVTAVAPGIDTITYRVTNVCGADTASFRFTVLTAAECALNINAHTGVHDMTLYPNPNHGTFTFSLPSDTNEEAHVFITNVVGRKIKELIIPTNEQVIIQLNKPPGIYFLSAITVDGAWRSKIIKQ